MTKKKMQVIFYKTDNKKLSLEELEQLEKEEEEQLIEALKECVRANEIMDIFILNYLLRYLILD
jgi:hypothetical protein